MRGSSFTFRSSDPARVGGSRAAEEMKNRQKDEDPKMSDRDRGGRKTDRKRERMERVGSDNVAICRIYDATTGTVKIPLLCLLF